MVLQIVGYVNIVVVITNVFSLYLVYFEYYY